MIPEPFLPFILLGALAVVVVLLAVVLTLLGRLRRRVEEGAAQAVQRAEAAKVIQSIAENREWIEKAFTFARQNQQWLEDLDRVMRQGIENQTAISRQIAGVVDSLDTTSGVMLAALSAERDAARPETVPGPAPDAAPLASRFQALERSNAEVVASLRGAVQGFEALGELLHAVQERQSAEGEAAAERWRLADARLPKVLPLAEQERMFEEQKRLFEAAPPALRRIHLTTMFALLPDLRVKVFEFFFAQAQAVIQQALAGRAYEQLPPVLNQMAESVVLFGNVEPPEVPAVLAGWVRQVNESVAARLGADIEASLAVEPEDPVLERTVLAGAPANLLAPELAARVQARIAEMEARIRTAQGFETLARIEAEMQSIPESADADTVALMAQQTDLKLIQHEAFAEGATRERYLEVKQALNRLRQRAMTLQLVRQIYADPDRLRREIGQVSEMAARSVLNGAQIRILDNGIEAVTPFIQAFEENLQDVDKRLLPFDVDLTEMRRLLENVSVIKSRSYNLWAVQLTARARENFKKATSIFKSKSDNYNEVRRVFEATIWRIDERQLDSTVLGLFNQVRQQMLDYIEEDHRLEFVKAGLEAGRATVYDIDPEAP